MLRHVLLAVLLIVALAAVGQPPAKNAASVRVMGLTYHPGGGGLPDLYPRKIDKRADFVFTPGFSLAYERFVLQRYISVKTTIGYYEDCAALTSYYAHLGFRLLMYRYADHSVYFGVGPTFAVRGDWNRFGKRYRDNGFYDRKCGWQYQFFWYGGEIDYFYKINRKTDLNICLVPGLPNFMLLQVGVRKWW